MILDDIAASTVKRVELSKKDVPLDEMRRLAAGKGAAAGRLKAFAFEQALKGPGIHFICEVKKASPSKGIIADNFPYEEIAAEYEAAGADCVSVLTEPAFFLGKNEYLTDIRRRIRIPILRKDFMVDEYQIYEAAAIGADCVLLICSLLDGETLRRFLEIADSLGLSALVEAHDEEEVGTAVRAGCRMLGVNNRNLKDFKVDIGNSRRLRELSPPEVLFVAESGISSREDVRALEEAGVNAVLVGETLMRSRDKKGMLKSLKGRGGTGTCESKREWKE